MPHVADDHPSPEFEHSVLINAAPTRVLAAFFDPRALTEWWQVARSVTTPRPMGVFAVEWLPTSDSDDLLGRLGGVFHGTVMEYLAGRELFVADAWWLPPDGDPIGRVQVLALRLVYDGGKQVLTIAQTVTTNDRGEYRMFWLTPGAYRVAARSFDAGILTAAVNIGPPRRFGTSEIGTGPLVNRRTLENGAVIEEVSVPIYSPSTPDPQLATPGVGRAEPRRRARARRL